MGTEALDRVCIGLPSGVEVGEEDGVKFAGQLLVYTQEQAGRRRARTEFGSTTPTICIPSFKAQIVAISATSDTPARMMRLAAPTRGV